MLLTTRKVGERIFIGDDIEVEIVEIRQSSVKVGITAPKNIQILRDDAIKREPPEQEKRDAERRSTTP